MQPAEDQLDMPLKAGTYYRPGGCMASKTTLLDQLHIALRLRHMSLRTEKACVSWARRFILFHNKHHPKEMGAEEIRAFLSHLPQHEHVAASTRAEVTALLTLSEQRRVGYQTTSDRCPLLSHLVTRNDENLS